MHTKQLPVYAVFEANSSTLSIELTMKVQTFIPTYSLPQTKKKEGGERIRIRHDILDAAEERCPKGVTLKAFLNEVLAERFL
jgi:hypothetical protein